MEMSQVTIHKWPTLDWNFCIPFTWASATEGGYEGQLFDMNSLLTWVIKNTGTTKSFRDIVHT